MLAFALLQAPCGAQEATESTPLAIGETFSIAAAVLDETRRINVYRPHVYGDPTELRLPVLYMPDGGVGVVI